MREGPLNPKYLRVEVRIMSFNQENFQNRPGNRNRGQNTSSRPRQTTEIIVLKETLEDMEDKIVEEDIEMIDIMVTIEAETGQEKGYLQEIIIVAEIEVQVTADPGQAPELIQTEIG